MKFKGLVVGLVAVATVGVLATYSCAAVYLTCSVNRTATTANGVTQLHLADTASTPAWVGNVWFTAPAGSDDQALATALTAMSLTKSVRIGLVDATSRAIIQIGLDAAE